MYIPVHRNRSIESIATLYDENNTELLLFTVRAHGYDEVCAVVCVNFAVFKVEWKAMTSTVLSDQPPHFLHVVSYLRTRTHLHFCVLPRPVPVPYSCVA